ncbi:hypothetical protein CTAYLR_003666 [Chrysophaeum taylorii]|uniref:PH domain-containing protein n=1 Tax=Chrysophaeum taylorii TaxID=2483200 RepID=A0AAD7UD42_9STRA|nr:hypothetical protein CTAYLR_003666 [Chrysophaeum taylorii]
MTPTPRRASSLNEVLGLDQLRERVNDIERGSRSEDDDRGEASHSSSRGAEVTTAEVEALLPSMLPRSSGIVALKGDKKKSDDRSWRDAWLVLRTQIEHAGDRVELVWYESRESTNPTGSFALSEAEVSAERRRHKKKRIVHTFELNAPRRTELELCAPTADERDEWIASISAAIDFAKKRELYPRARWVEKQTDDALNCEAFGPGLYQAVCGETATFSIVATTNGAALDAGGLEFTARLESSSLLYLLEVRDEGNGTYECEYAVARAGDYELSVLLRDEYHVFGSPFPVRIVPGPASAAASVLRGAERVVPHRPAHFELRVRDRFGNDVEKGGDVVDARVDGAGRVLGVVDDNDGSYSCAYEVTREPVALWVSLGGRAVPGSPLRPVVVDDEPYRIEQPRVEPSRDLWCASIRDDAGVSSIASSPPREGSLRDGRAAGIAELSSSLPRRIDAIARDRSVTKVIVTVDAQLRHVFRYYSTVDSVSHYLELGGGDTTTTTNNRKRHGLIALARDFEITPLFVAAALLKACYAAVHSNKRADPAGLNYSQFASLVVLLADVAYTTSSQDESLHQTPRAAKLAVLLVRWGLADPVRLERIRNRT